MPAMTGMVSSLRVAQRPSRSDADLGLLLELVQLMAFVCVQALSKRKSISYTRYQGHLHHLARRLGPRLPSAFKLFSPLR